MWQRGDVGVLKSEWVWVAFNEKCKSGVGVGVEGRGGELAAAVLPV